MIYGIWSDILSVLLISTHTPLLDNRTESLDSSSLHIRIREVLLTLSEEVPVRKIRDVSIVGCNSTGVVEAPECNLNSISRCSLPI